MTAQSRNCFNDIAALAARIVRELRRRGLNVSASDAVTAARLLDAYSATGEVSRDDLVDVFIAACAKRPGEDEVVRKVVLDLCGGRTVQPAVMVRDAIYADLARLGVRAGSAARFSIRRMGREEREAFARLSLVGVIRKTRRGYYVSKPSQIDTIAQRLAAKHGGYHEAVAARLEDILRKAPSDIPRLLGDSVLEYVDFNKMTVREMTNLYRSLTAKRIKDIVARRLSEKVKHEGVSKNDAEAAASVLEQHRLLDIEASERLLEAEPRLATRLARHLGLENVLDTAARIAHKDPNAAALMASRALGDNRLAPAYELLARMGMIHKAGLLDTSQASTLLNLAEAFRSLLAYLKGGGEGYLDAAEYYLEQVKNSQYDNEELRLLHSSLAKALADARRGSLGNTLSILVRYMEPFEAVEFLSSIAANGDEHLRRLALTIARRVIEKARKSIQGKARITCTHRSAYGERLDLRETMFNLVREAPSPLVWRKERPINTLVLVLDKSASMRPYSFYALIVASSLAPLVERLVIFDEKARIYTRRSFRRNGWRRLVEYMLATQFEGYTDISGALEAATRGLSPRRLVLISDMRQTVLNRDEPAEVIKELTARGWRVSIVTPLADNELIHVLRSEAIRGLDIYVVSQPREVARVVEKIASLN